MPEPGPAHSMYRGFARPSNDRSSGRPYGSPHPPRNRRASQLPKAAPVIRALGAYPVKQLLVHTGQHYDDKMSDVFFRELQLPRPMSISASDLAAMAARLVPSWQR